MTFEKLLSDLSFDIVSPKQAYDDMISKDKMKRINYYIHIGNTSKESLKDSQLQELNAIVNILQILYNSSVDSPVPDSTYDTLQEMLVDMGIPRLSGSIEINNSKKVSHKFKNLRGTLDKIYYLNPNEKRTNKSRKYLDEWIKSAEDKYERKTGKKINLNNTKIILQPKFDGISCVLELDDKALWITRGDTVNNKASDVSHIMNIFNNLYSSEETPCAIKFEVMMTEENKDKINELYRHKQYKNSRQIVTATLNSIEADFKADYLYPIPLRIIHYGDDVESIHPTLIEKFPTKICTFADRDIIKQFANENKWVYMNGMRFRTDGIVLTILDHDIQITLGRENNVNKFEVAYKFTEESAYTRVKDIEFYISDFGFITPVLVVNDVILKGNTINRISLSNKERFDELNFSYGDDVKILYDIIPYATVDEKCKRVPNGRKIKFIENCPRCHEPLDLSVVQVQCKNKNCPSRIVGRIFNYCSNLRMQNIGYQTLDMLYSSGFLNHGIRSLYKLKKKSHDIEDIEGFGKIKTRKMIKEIESKRKLKDYEFFGSLGIENLSIKTFQTLFSQVKLSEFLDMISNKKFDNMIDILISVNGIGPTKAEFLVSYLKDTSQRVEIQKILSEVSLYETYGNEGTKGRIIFTGCRPSDELINILSSKGYEVSDSWSNKAKYLVIPSDDYESNKVTKAKDKGVQIISINGKDPITSITRSIK